MEEKLFFKYLINSIEKQKQQDKPIDFSIKQSSTYPFGTSNNLPDSNEDILLKFYQQIQQNSSPPNKRLTTNTSPIADNYSDRRRKNNEAAKRSRDVRRMKEDEIAIKATWLEQENLQLRLENAHLKQENIQLRCQIYSSPES